MRAIYSIRIVIACVVLGVPSLIACARSSDRPPATNEQSPVVVPAAPKAAEGEEAAGAVPERLPRTSERAPTHQDELADESSPDWEVDVQQDGGVFSFSAKTVRDGGFSFRFSGSVHVASDGAVSVTISPDAGSP